MKRRTLLQSITAALIVQPLTRLGLVRNAEAMTLVSQAPATALTEANVVALKAMAEVVLPTALGESGRTDAVNRFTAWVRDYREGADRGHSYGSSTLSAKTGASPAARYPQQFTALDEMAVTRGAASFAALPIAQRREVIDAALNQPQRVTAMPARPNGTSLVADFMGYYFGSERGFDLAYNASIGRDTCRGLEGSDQAPMSLGKA